MTTESSVHSSRLDLQIQFARLVSPPGVALIRPINENNESEALVGWSPELLTRPYALPISNEGRFHTIALDFDAPADNPQAADDDARSAAFILAKGGVLAVVCASGPTGGRHVMARVTGRGIGARTARDLVVRLRYLGLVTLDSSCMTNVRSQCIRPPYSPHRRGGMSQPMGDDHIALATLEFGNEPEAIELLVRSLPSRSRSLSRDPAASATAPASVADRSYGSGSDAVQGLATRLANRGGQVDDLRAAVAESKQPQIVETVTKRGSDPEELERWLRRSMRVAEAFVVTNPAIASQIYPDRMVIDAWDAALPSVASQLSDSGMKFAQVVLEECRRHGRCLVGMSLRQAVEAGGLARSSAGRGKDRLIELGMIVQVDPGHRLEGARYRLQHPATWTTRTGGTVSPPSLGGVGQLTVPRMHAHPDDLTRMSSDLWTRNGLGERGRQIYLVLLADTLALRSSSAARIAARMDITESQVRRYFRRLVEVGLGRRLEGGRWAAERRAELAVAIQLGVDGTHERRMATIRNERRAHVLRAVESRFKAVGIAPAPDWFDLVTGALEDEVHAASWAGAGTDSWPSDAPAGYESSMQNANAALVAAHPTPSVRAIPARQHEGA